MRVFGERVYVPRVIEGGAQQGVVELVLSGPDYLSLHPTARGNEARYAVRLDNGKLSGWYMEDQLQKP